MCIAERHKLFSTMTTNWDAPLPINISYNGRHIAKKYNINYITNELLIRDLKENNVDIHCIDLNKAYTTFLLKLKFLPVIDETCVPVKFNYGDEIIETNFYFVERTIKALEAYVAKGICSGYRLKGISKFCDITYTIVPILIQNPFTHIIGKMLKKDPKLTKTIVNRFIGVMQRAYRNVESTSFKVCNIFNNQNEAELTDLKCIEFDQLYLSIKEFETKTCHIKTNMLPIGHYIVDNCVYKIRTTIDKMTLDGIIVDMIQIKTDCITYIGKPANFKLNETSIGGYKEIDPSLPKNIVYSQLRSTHKRYELKELFNFELGNNILGDCSAGCGKTFFIKNTIIPKLDKNNKSYFVCCSQWQPIADYECDITSMKRLMKTNSVNDKHFADYEYIIIDEAGLLTSYHWEWLYANKKVHHKILAFGDNQQLLPVGDNIKTNPLASVSIRAMFDYKYVLDTNYRNKYTDSDYENMRNGSFVPTQYELNQDNRRLPDWNIVYFNKTKDAINNARTRTWKDVINIDIDGKTVTKKIMIGAKISCIDNKLKAHGIYNKQIFNVVSYLDRLVIKRYDNDKEYILSKDDYIHFEFAYALTLYGVQGMSIQHGTVAFHDVNHIKEKIPNGVYVMYSRIMDKKDLVIIKNPELTVDFD
jgi:hypothetical protein